MISFNLSRFQFVASFCLLALGLNPGVGFSQECAGNIKEEGGENGFVLDGGGFAVWSNIRINIDGSARAYHPQNKAGNALIHLCNAGEVFLPDGSHYYGSDSNATCTGKFMDDYKRIGSAGWDNPSVGAIRWFGVLGTGSAKVAGKTIKGVRPVLQPSGSGFYVSPTSLQDRSYAEDDQQRYIEPLSVSAAVIPSGSFLRSVGVENGTLGVAIRRGVGMPAPFVVGDFGPRIGEVTPALARRLADKPVDLDLTYDHRHRYQIDDSGVLYVFFAGPKISPPYDAATITRTATKAYEAWGGSDRLEACVANPVIPKNKD